jgi:hypothetical protein
MATTILALPIMMFTLTVTAVSILVLLEVGTDLLAMFFTTLVVAKSFGMEVITM